MMLQTRALPVTSRTLGSDNGSGLSATTYEPILRVYRGLSEDRPYHLRVEGRWSDAEKSGSVGAGSILYCSWAMTSYGPKIPVLG